LSGSITIEATRLAVSPPSVRGNGVGTHDLWIGGKEGARRHEGGEQKEFGQRRHNDDGTTAFARQKGLAADGFFFDLRMCL
jgi:hypothetical protein